MNLDFGLLFAVADQLNIAQMFFFNKLSSEAIRERSVQYRACCEGGVVSMAQNKQPVAYTPPAAAIASAII